MSSVTEIYKEAAGVLLKSVRLYDLEDALTHAYGNPLRRFTEQEFAAFEQWLEDNDYYECEICGDWTRFDCLECGSKLCVECGLYEDECNCDEGEDE